MGLNINSLSNSDISIKKESDNFFLEYGERHYKINPNFYMILDFQLRKHSQDKIVNYFIELNGFDHKMVECLINEYNLFIDKIESNYNAKKISYIKAKFTLLPPKATQIISSKLSFLHRKYIMCMLLILSIGAHFYYFFNKPALINFDFSTLQVIIYYFIALVLLFFHELGHSSASVYNKIVPKEIGIGFYFIFPVYFSDVTRIWTLPKWRKVQVNLAGIYFQFIINLILILSLYMVSYKSQVYFIHFINLNIAVILYTLVPFFRNDGYWVFSDIFSISNLLKKSDLLVSDIITYKPKLWKEKYLNVSNTPLIIYAFSNWLFRFYILYVLLKGIYNNIYYTTLNIHELSYTKIAITSIKISALGVGVYFILSYVYMTFIKKKKLTGI